ncbi:MAG TPA: ATP-binding protein [Deltaproteobacteria bacterium]|nr:ATP-binding protein [Deltaproteobacteria bacterium]HPR53670.1 ATP-binding protein [Deltaproteobacteria bacterium]HXK47186.1 ATP-binding protein [Deltaproteobacteria bacterium]
MISKGSTFFRSIRFRFLAWYGLILAATFILFSVVLFVDLRRTLYDKLDDVLLSRAEGVAQSINTYWETEKVEGLRRGAKSSLFSKINNANFVKIANRWVDERSDDPELVDIMVQIYTHEGRLIAYSRTAPFKVRLSERSLERIRKKGAVYQNRSVKLTSGPSQDLRTLIYPVLEGKAVSYIVEVASPLTHVSNALDRLRFLLFLLLPATVIITGLLAGEFLASITLKPLKDMIATVQDITAERLDQRLHVPASKDEIRQLADTFNEMLDKIAESIASQRRFIHDLSHEMRTPLTILRGELDVALKRDRSPDQYRETLQSNLEEIEKISRILDGLLVLARIENEEQTLEKEPCDLVGLVRDTLADIEVLAGQKAIEVDFRSEGEAVVPVNREKMRRVLINLFDNAVKYTAPGGLITVVVSPGHEAVDIAVRDTGAGIPGDELPHIFERFYRSEGSRNGRGFGLGLSIARTIVLAHKGTITCESTPGRGTTFTVTLPV